MIKKLLKNIRGRFAGYLAKKPVNRWPIVLRARWAMKQYKKLEGHTFDLAHPELFTEKIVWYRLFYRHPDMTRIYDKYLFKDYIAEKLDRAAVRHVDGRAGAGSGLGRPA